MSIFDEVLSCSIKRNRKKIMVLCSENKGFFFFLFFGKPIAFISQIMMSPPSLSNSALV